MKHHLYRYSQRGAALLTALLIMVLVAIAATAINAHLLNAIQQAKSETDNNDLFLATRQVLNAAIDDLLSMPNLTRIDPIFPQAQVFNHIELNGIISEQQGLFNINNLSNDNYLISFRNMLQAIIPNLSMGNATHIGVTLYQHLRGLNRMFMPLADRQFQSVSELQGFTPISAGLLTKISPYLTALPTVTPVNINSASLPVLMTIPPGLPTDIANKIIAKRQQYRGFTTLDQFFDDDEIKKFNIHRDDITVQSEFFLVTATAKRASQQLIVYDLLQRQTIQNKVQVRVLWESRNVY